MNEIWKPVVGYEGFYEVSNHGLVKSLGGRTGSAKKPKLLTQSVHKEDGHCRVSVCVGRERRYLSVHRVVLEAFVGPCPPGLEAGHLDGNPSNNSVGNLQWITHLENMRHKYAHGTMGVNRKGCRLDGKAISSMAKYMAKGLFGFGRYFNNSGGL